MDNQKSWQKITGILIILVVALGVGYYIYTDTISAPSLVDDGEVLGSERSDTDIEDNNTETVGEGDIPMGDIPTVDGKEAIDIPDLNRPIAFFIELPQELQDAYQNRIESLTQELTLDSGAVNNWIALGVQRKGIGDYEGAREIWEYVNIISPLNNVSFFNLGDLYHFYLRDYAAAEQNLLVSKDNNEGYIPVYRALYDLYHISYKQETSAAEDILREGLLKNPNNLDLLVLLAAHYKEKGNTNEARSFYDQALEEAKAAENQSMVGLLQEELNNL